METDVSNRVFLRMMIFTISSVVSLGFVLVIGILADLSLYARLIAYPVIWIVSWYQIKKDPYALATAIGLIFSVSDRIYFWQIVSFTLSFALFMGCKLLTVYWVTVVVWHYLVESSGAYLAAAFVTIFALVWPTWRRSRAGS